MYIHSANPAGICIEIMIHIKLDMEPFPRYSIVTWEELAVVAVAQRTVNFAALFATEIVVEAMNCYFGRDVTEVTYRRRVFVDLFRAHFV